MHDAETSSQGNGLFPTFSQQPHEFLQELDMLNKRIGIVGLLHESNTFIAAPTTLADFEANLLVSGEAVLSTFRGTDHEIGGFLQTLDSDPTIEPVGIFVARAMPYGAIERRTWQRLTDELLEHLRDAGPLDGLLVAPHGATVAEGTGDADGDWLARVRQVVGPDVPILGTLDLHANVSAKMIEMTDGLAGYQTNPHLDQRARGAEVGRWMIETLQSRVRVTQCGVFLPMAVNIERQATDEPHGRRLRTLATSMQATYPRVLSVSFFYGFPYADVAEMGASIVVVTDDDYPLAHAVAAQLADAWWSHRADYEGQLLSIREAVQLAVNCRKNDPTRPVGLLDMGDNVGGGSAGDGTELLHAWREAGQGSVLAILAAPQIVRAAQAAGCGAELSCEIGGTTDDRHGRPFADTFRVQRLTDGRFTEDAPRHGGYRHFNQGPTAVLESTSSNGPTLIATTLRVAPMSLQQVLSQGIRIEDFAAVIIKGVHAPVAAYTDDCQRLVRVNSPGSTCADLGQFVFHKRRRPMFPWEACESPKFSFARGHAIRTSV